MAGLTYSDGEMHFVAHSGNPKATRIAGSLPGFLLMSWNLLCFTFESEPNQAKLYWNGRLIAIDQEFTIVDPILETFLVVGQEQDAFLGGFDKQQSLSGKVSQIGFWNRTLSTLDIKGINECHSLPEDNLIQWTDLTLWNMSAEAQTQYISEEEFCQRDIMRNKLVINSPQSWKTFSPLCDSMGGRLPISSPEESPAETLVLFENLLRIGNAWDPTKPLAVLAGATCTANGTWLDGNGHKLNMSYFNVQSSNKDNCSFLFDDEIRQTSCDQPYSSAMCYLKEHKLYLKGMPHKYSKIFDTEYYVYGMHNRNPFFRGVMNSHISATKFYRWTLESHIVEGYVAHFSATPEVQIPLGRHSWKFHKYTSDGVLASKTLALTLSLCGNDQFTCDNGECIDLAHKCDTITECKDGSDEKGCSYVQMSGIPYARELVPRKSQTVPAVVTLTFEVIDIPVIDTFGQKILVDFMFLMEWKDYRLTFVNLHQEEEINELGTSIKGLIWVPRLFFLNALKSTYTVIDGSNAFMVRRHDNPIQSDLSEASEAYIYSGEQCTIISEREYMEEFSCVFQLHYYPFDKQVCKIVVQVAMKKKHVVLLNTVKDHGVRFLGNRRSTEYEILYEETVSRVVRNHSQVILHVMFSRRVEFHLATTFFQTGLLCCVGILTFWFKIDNFTDRIMVTLTTMLVVATISSSIQSDLPKTYYFKLIDIWLLFSLCVLCCTIAGHTCIAYILHSSPKSKVQQAETREDVQNKMIRAQRMNKMITIIVAIITILFNGVYWTVAVSEYFRQPDEFMAAMRDEEDDVM